MTILVGKNLGRAFGADVLFGGVNIKIFKNARIGLVGPNGIGKTTLLRILSAIEDPSTGSISVAEGVRIGYLRQEAIEAFAEKDNTVYEEMLTVFAALRQVEAHLRELESQMEMDASDDLLHRYGNQLEMFEHLGGYDYETLIEKTLGGLGFARAHYEMSLQHLSGGQKTRALLARLLLEQPDLLILDEPTNHLDVEAIEWLEGTLRNWKGALLIVSHDRYFLDKVTTTTWEMRADGVDEYRGNYSAYIQQRQERWEYHLKLYEQERERLLEEIDYVKRNIARASTNGMAVGRLRLLSRDVYAIHQVGILAYKNSRSWSELDLGAVRPYGVEEAEKLIKSIPAPAGRPPKLNIRLKTTYRSGEIVIRSRQLVVGYPDVHLFSADDIRLERQECAALIGNNGTGKTTFLKTIMGEIAPLSGTIQLGINLKIGYFAQAHDTLNPDQRVIDAILHHKNIPVSEARHYLAHYLFRGDDVFKKIGMLSGGERARLALAILALQGANFLLLDEPTNHLDIPAQEVLQEVLENFEGTILLVSHDRYLIDHLATQIWSLEEGHLSIFKGDYQAFIAAQEAHSQAEKDARAAAKQEKKTARISPNHAKIMRQLETQIQEAESLVEALNSAIVAASGSQDFLTLNRLTADYSAAQATLEQLVNQWTALAEV